MISLTLLRHAFLALTQLKAVPSNLNNIANFLKSLRDESTGLYAPKAGAKGNVEATAYAVQVLEALGEAGKAQLKEASAKLSAYVKNALTQGQFFAFPEVHPLSAQYFATEIAEAVGYDLAPAAEKVCKFITEQLAKLPVSAANTEVVFHAVAALKALGAAAKTDCVGKVDEDAVRAAFDDAANTLNSAAYLYQALALTDELADLFREKVLFTTQAGAPVGSRLIFGTTVKPTFATEPANPNFNVALEASIPNAVVLDSLAWDAAKRVYVGKEVIKTSSGLGKAGFKFTVSLPLAALGGNVQFVHEENRAIGYGIAVDAEAMLEGGRTVAEGATVSPGTEFKFGVTLHSDTEANILAGDFDVVFTVLDASHVEVHSEKSARRGNSSPIRFTYVLKNNNLPAGELLFRFDVAAALTGVHTTDSVSYRLSAPMVAGSIQVAKSYKLGETVKVSMEPGVLSGLRNVVALAASKAGARNFLLDLKSPGGVLLHSVKGASQGSRVSFELPLAATFDSIGTHLVSFRFVAANGEATQIANYDSAANELYDENNAVAFTVAVDLVFQPVGAKPAASAFVYGADIAYNFKVKDALSGLEVKPGHVEAANVYLALRAADGGRGQVSVHLPAKASDKGLSVQWTINPNAVRGAGVVELAAEDADGNAYPLHEEGKKESVQLQVNIGGSIDVTQEAVATTVFDRRGNPKTAFVVKFALACKGKSLSGAALKAVVDHVSEAGVATTVASGLPVATSGADYEVSWAAANRAASGTYRIRFFREADRVKADSAAVFEIAVPHESGATTKLPVRTEFLAVLALLGLYLAAHQRRSKYEKTK